MNVSIIFFLLCCLSISWSLPTNNIPQSTNLEDSIAQSKRDLSLSYAATDIGTKDGSRAKTITVIKNVVGKKEQPIKVNPKLHQNDNWGSEFRDNFDSYGVIPEVPDIDELFEFVNKKKENKKPKDKDNAPGKKPQGDESKPKKDEKEEPKENGKEETTLPPAPVEEVTEENKEEKVEKIAGDAELIQPAGKQGKVKLQSLDMGKYSVREFLDDDNNPNLQNSDNQHFIPSAKNNEKYIQSTVVGYNYPEANLKGYVPPNNYSPQPQIGRGSITVTTPSGKSYDVPFENTTANPPYLAPNFRRNQNSSNQQFSTSSQRPYVAPNLRKPYEAQLNNTNPTGRDCATSVATSVIGNRQQPTFNVYRNVAPIIRPDAFGRYKPRSRGLRY